jgi:spore maturation protein CgeB
MRLMLCEDWDWRCYGEIFFRRFQELGVQVLPFKFRDYFANGKTGLSRLRDLESRVQRRFRWGPRVARLNKALLDAAGQFKPEVAFLYRCDLVWPETLLELSKKGIFLVGYNNDDPFSKAYPRYTWRHLIAGIPYYNLYFAYRQKNIPEYERRGCRSVAQLRSHYIREIHHPVNGDLSSSYLWDVSFTGHWEDDGREDYIRRILDRPAIRFRLFGNADTWKHSSIFGRVEARCGPIVPKYEAEYNTVLTSSKLALVFLSAINNDTYTRRCFEIPAAGTFMLSQYSEELDSLFQEGREAEYFRSPDEMLDKLDFYLKHDAARTQIAQAGHQRLLRDGHEASDRVRTVLDWIARVRT